MNDIRQGIRWGAGVFGFLKAWKRNWKANRNERRAEKRGERPADGADDFQLEPKEGRTMAINTGLRSSSNSAIAAVIVNVVVGVVNGLFPDFTIPADWLVYLTAGAMWVVGRFTKTPDAPKAI